MAAVGPQGPQESVYVVLELRDIETIPTAGSRLQLQGMETQQPVLQLSDGTRLVGAFEETVGTQLVLADSTQGDGSHVVQLVAHTDKRIRFSRLPSEEAQQGGPAEMHDTAAAAADGAPEVAGLQAAVAPT